MLEKVEIKKNDDKLITIKKRQPITMENPYYFLIMMAPDEPMTIETFDLLAGPKPSNLITSDDTYV